MVLAGCCLTGCVATDRERDGLRGRVKTVKTELAKISTNPHYVEGMRTLLMEVTYARNGMRLQQSCYWADKSFTSSRVTLVDGTGQRLDIASHYKDGTVDSKLVRRFDGRGRQTEELLFDTDGSIGHRVTFHVGEIQGGVGSVTSPKWVYTHDPRGRKLTKRLYDEADQTVLLESTYTYDDTGRLSDVASYREGEVLLGRWTYGYDAQDRRAEVTFSGSEGQPVATWRYRYEGDRNGNWTRRMAERLVNQTGDWKPAETVYREITYWGWWR